MTALGEKIRAGFIAAGMPDKLVAELFKSFGEAKRRFYRADLRPSEIEGARFSESVFRVLQWATAQGTYTPIGKTLPTVDKMMATLENANGPDSVRIHIPRTLRLIYDVRNKRDVAHLGDGIDPNEQDAALVINNMDWVMAELVRLYHNVSASEAHEIIRALVTKDVPLIQEFGGFPRILGDLGASEYVLVLLYWRASAGASAVELKSWVRPRMRSNLLRTLNGLDAKDLIHLDADTYLITRLGEARVESRKLLEPA